MSKIEYAGLFKDYANQTSKMYKVSGVSKRVLDLDKTFNCGQSFRWKKLSGGTYLGGFNDIALIIKRISDTEIITTANENIWKNYMIKYFDLANNYRQKIELNKLSAFELKSYEMAEGIRILHQDLWEALVSFIISQRNNIPKIIGSIDKLCKSYSENKIQVAGLDWYKFPTPEQIYKEGKGVLSACGLGYRVDYVFDLAKLVYSNRLRLSEFENSKISLECLVDKLKEIRGVGDKVANCVALFGLGRLDAFPVDVWMERILESYPINVTNYAEVAGVMQQYMFYNVRGKNL